MIEQLVDEFSSKCDYIDVRVNKTTNEVVILQNSETSNVFTNNESYGVRVLLNGGWGLSFSHDFNKAREVFEKALKIAKLSSGKKTIFNPPKSVHDSKKISYKTDPFSVDPLNKIKLLNNYEALLKKDTKIKNTVLSLACSRVDKRVYAPNINVRQEFVNNFLRINVTAREGNLIQSTAHRHSELGGYETINSLSTESLTSEVRERVNRLLHAKSSKPERATIVCDPQLTGLFFHEAVGHACEADLILNNGSVFNGLRDKSLGSEEINLVNDPTFKERGFYWYDDEGVKTKPTPLITKGVLTGFMHSLKTANELNEKPTGNGRCMNAEVFPIPRMSNMILKPGKWSFEELLKEAGNGYFVKGFTGGEVDPITGQFCFGASECYRIVNGEVGEPLRDVTLASSILESLKSIKVGNDFVPTNSGGTCGKGGQGARVGEACPSILIKDVIVGGSA